MSAFIPLQEGIAMTTAYRQARAALITAGVVAVDFLPLCETFEKSQVLTLLNKSGCESLRAYLGLKDEKITLIFVGANQQGEDMIPNGTARLTADNDDGDDDDDLLNRGFRCPTNCPPASALNT